MKELFKISHIELRINEKDYIKLIQDHLEIYYGCTVPENLIGIAVDLEIGFVAVVIDEENISEELAEKLASNGFNIQERYEMTNAILRSIFKTDNVSSYVDLDEYESMLENNDVVVPIQIGYEDYLKWEKYNSEYIDLPCHISGDEKLRLISFFMKRYEFNDDGIVESLKMAYEIIDHNRVIKEPSLYGYKKELIQDFPLLRNVLEYMNDEWS